MQTTSAVVPNLGALNPAYLVAFVINNERLEQRKVERHLTLPIQMMAFFRSYARPLREMDRLNRAEVI